MPCYDGRDDDLNRENAKLKSALCGVFSYLEAGYDLDKVLCSVDWKGVGVSREFVEKWWERHKKEDARRKKLELEWKEKRREEELRELNRLERKYHGKSGKL